MEDTYNLLKSSNFLVGRANGKTIFRNHVANIVIAVSKNIKKTALKETKNKFPSLELPEEDLKR